MTREPTPRIGLGPAGSRGPLRLASGKPSGVGYQVLHNERKDGGPLLTIHHDEPVFGYAPTCDQDALQIVLHAIVETPREWNKIVRLMLQILAESDVGPSHIAWDRIGRMLDQTTGG